MAQKAIIGQDYYKELSTKAVGSDEDTNYFKKALTYDTANSGADMIPEAWAANVIRQIYENGWHRQLLNTISMRTLKMNIPKFSTRWSAKYLSAAITSTDPANQITATSTSASTDERELELKTLTLNLMIDNKFLTYNADAQIETVLREDMVNGLMESEIDAIINGDDSVSHQDSDVTDADDPRVAFKGLRKLAAATSVDASNGEFGVDEVSKMIKSLGRYAQGRKDELVLLVSPAIADHIRRNVTQLQTLEKYGPQATIFVGEIGKIFGVSVIETNYLAEDLNASGVYDGSTTDRTTAVMFNAKQAFIGVPSFVERSLNIQKWNDPRFDRVQLILTEDFGFNVRHTDSVVKCINVATTAAS